MTLYHDPTGRQCALAGRLLSGDDPMADACPACISDSVPPMLSETTLDDAGHGTLMVGATPYQVQRIPGATTGYLMTGPRGATYGLLPYVKQRYPGVRTFFLVNANPRRAFTGPRWAQGLTFVVVADRLGFIR